jgi:hypothetical protein
MKKGKQLMKSTAGSITPQATRLAAFTFAITAVLATPGTARSIDSPKPNLDAAINRSAPARPPAAKPAAPAPARNNNATRPASNAAHPAAARPSASTSRPSEASRPAAARPNTARPEAARNAPRTNAARPEAARNAAHESRPEARHEAAGRDGHGARAGEHGHPAARNAAYHHGENLHGGHRIPEARFRGSFGREHQFRIGHPVMIGGQASFQFGGFWFGIVDPWPAAWLYTDAVFVDLVEGEYVLVNVAHPEVTVAVSAGDPAPTTCNAETAAPVEPVVAATPVVAAPVVAAPVVSAPIVVSPVIAIAVPVPYLAWHYWWHFRR